MYYSYQVYMVRPCTPSAVTPVTHTKPSHLSRAPPTAYGAAEMASPPYGSHSRSSRSRSSSSSTTAAAAAAAAATAAAMAFRHRRRCSSRTCRNHARSRPPLASLLLLTTQTRRQSTLHKTSFKNQKPQEMVLVLHPYISESSKLEK